MHRHQYRGRKLGREAAQRKTLMRGLASQIILYEKITTTLPKAKEVRPVIEKLITRAKIDSVANRRQVAKFLSNKDKALEKLFVELGPLYKNRNGGYTRIVKLGNRVGDNAPIAQIQLLDTEKLTKKAVEKASKQSATSNKGSEKKSAVKSAKKSKVATKSKIKMEAPKK